MDEGYLKHFIGKPHKILLDSSAIICFLEGVPQYLPVLLPIFQAIEEGGWQAVVAGITEYELLIKPHKENNECALEKVKIFLEKFPNVSVVKMNPRIAELAAELLVGESLDIGESIIAATALYSGCDFLLTNDRELASKAGTGINFLVAADLCEF